MKKPIVILLIFSILLSLNISASAASAESSMKYKTLPDGTLEITGYNGAQGKKPVIPSEINGRKVTSIGKYAFMRKIVSVKIPSTVKVIKNEAFSTESLKSVRIPSSVKKIYSGAFASTKITKIAIPSSVKKVGRGVFEDCKKLKKVVIKNGLKKISGRMFASCKKLEKIVIPRSVKVIGEEAFEDCGLKVIKIGKGVKRIGKGAFSSYEGKPRLERFKVDKNNRYFSSAGGVLFNKDKTELIAYPVNRGGGKNRSDSFKKVPKLTDEQKSKRAYTIPKSVKKLRKGAFTGSNVQKIVITGEIKQVSAEAFSSCEDLSEVTMEDGVESVGKNAFYDCFSLNTVNLPETLKTIEEGAFIYSGVEKINLPEGLETIEKEAFLGCNFSEITIPKTVEAIGISALGFEVGDCGVADAPEKDFVIKGYKDTEAQRYAKNYGFEFKQLMGLPEVGEHDFPIWIVISACALFAGALAVVIVKLIGRKRKKK